MLMYEPSLNDNTVVTTSYALRLDARSPNWYSQLYTEYTYTATGTRRRTCQDARQVNGRLHRRMIV